MESLIKKIEDAIKLAKVEAQKEITAGIKKGYGSAVLEAFQDVETWLREEIEFEAFKKIINES